MSRECLGCHAQLGYSWWEMSHKEEIPVFLELGPRPKGKTLDRINPYGDYAPGNVRWATWREQRLNQRRAQGQGGEDDAG